MSELSFFDTNIIIYTDDASEMEKHARADALFREHER
jgi:predicted nucleic acid-binding protein